MFLTAYARRNTFNYELFYHGIGPSNYSVFKEKTVPTLSGTQISVEVKDNTDSNNLTCEAEIRKGSVPVPTVMDLLTPSAFGNTNNDLVSYIVCLKGCAAGDDVKVISSVPSGKTVTSWLDIK